MQAGSWMANAAKTHTHTPSLTLANPRAHASKQGSKRMFHHLTPFRAAVTGCSRVPSPHTDPPHLPARAEAAGMPCESTAILGTCGSLHALA